MINQFKQAFTARERRLIILIGITLWALSAVAWSLVVGWALAAVILTGMGVVAVGGCFLIKRGYARRYGGKA